MAATIQAYRLCPRRYKGEGYDAKEHGQESVHLATLADVKAQIHNEPAGTRSTWQVDLLSVPSDKAGIIQLLDGTAEPMIVCSWTITSRGGLVLKNGDAA